MANETSRLDSIEVRINKGGQLKHTNNQMTIKGIPSSPGIAIGRATVIEPETIIVPTLHIEPEKIPSELERFELAMQELIQEFLNVLDKVKKEASNVGAIIETNLLILTDQILMESIESRIRQGFSAESSVVQEFDHQKQYFKHAKDKILQERAIELDQTKERLLASLRNSCVYYAVPSKSIVVAQSLTPTDIVHFKEAGIVGIITEVGGIASHASILARSFEIPAVIGLKEATKLIDSGAIVVVDGYSGAVIINPTHEKISDYTLKKKQVEDHRKALGKLIKLQSKTRDGRRIHLMSNISVAEDLDASVVVGAEGIGLVRSEQIIISLNHFPDEEDQFKWYYDIANRSYPNYVTIRTFDIGSDKYSEGMPRHEANPALGLRGIRFLLSRHDIFISQVYAILRASANKNVRLMLPMITNVKEVEQSKNIIEVCKQGLVRRDLPFDKNIPIGVMIETPAAALISERLSEMVDFFSIGTNDLTQYTLAADRTNELLSEIFDSFHPAVLRLVKLVTDNAIARKVPVGVCGELAAHSASTALLIGLGIIELSVAPSILLETKSRIRETNYVSAIELADRALTCSTCEEVRSLLAF